MKKLLILGGAAALVFSSCGTKGGNLKNVTDTLAYTMGMELGEYVKNMDSVMEMKFDLATVVAAMKDVAKGDTSVMTRQQAMDFIQEYYMVRKPRIDSAANADFLAQVEKDNKNVKKTESGLLYEIVREGEGAKPDSADNVFVTYKLSDRKGNVIEDRSAEGDTTKLNMARVIPGWAEGLKMIGKGGKINAWMPSSAAYGAEAEVILRDQSPACLYDDDFVAEVAEAIKETAGPDKLAPDCGGGGEDFHNYKLAPPEIKV